MSEHTPGPWEAREDYDSTWWVVQSGPAQDLAIHDLSEANARLIAAAPDMLEALKMIASRMFHTLKCAAKVEPESEEECDCDHIFASAAIAKARGE